jgi:plastocyanin domain-containing protein
MKLLKTKHASIEIRKSTPKETIYSIVGVILLALLIWWLIG